VRQAHNNQSLTVINVFAFCECGLRADWEIWQDWNKCFEMWWPGTELNRRRQPFQGCALPPELPGHVRTRVVGCAGHEGCSLRAVWGRDSSRRRQHRCEACRTLSIIATEPNPLNGRRELIPCHQAGNRRALAGFESIAMHPHIVLIEICTLSRLSIREEAASMVSEWRTTGHDWFSEVLRFALFSSRSTVLS
jgi:hypothetical protein